MNAPAPAKITFSQINTAGIVIAIVVAVGAPIIVQSQNNARFELLTANLIDANKQMATRLDALDADRRASKQAYESMLRDQLATITKLGSASDSVVSQISGLQKQDENTDARMNRITEAYGGKLDSLVGIIGDIKTQQALTNQKVDELKLILQKYTERKGDPTSYLFTWNQTAVPLVRRQ